MNKEEKEYLNQSINKISMTLILFGSAMVLAYSIRDEKIMNEVKRQYLGRNKESLIYHLRDRVKQMSNESKKIYVPMLNSAQENMDYQIKALRKVLKNC